MATPEILPPLESDAEREKRWKATRRERLTGTDIAALFGRWKLRTPIDVWLDKQGRSQFVGNEQTEFGQELQSGILRVYSRRVGQPIELADPFTSYSVPGVPLLGASLDARWADGDRRPVDAKNVRANGGPD